MSRMGIMGNLRSSFRSRLSFEGCSRNSFPSAVLRMIVAVAALKEGVTHFSGRLRAGWQCGVTTESGGVPANQRTSLTEVPGGSGSTLSQTIDFAEQRIIHRLRKECISSPCRTAAWKIPVRTISA